MDSWVLSLPPINDSFSLVKKPSEQGLGPRLADVKWWGMTVHRWHGQGHGGCSTKTAPSVRAAFGAPGVPLAAVNLPPPKAGHRVRYTESCSSELHEQGC